MGAMTERLPPGWHRGAPPHRRPDAVFVRGTAYADTPEEAWTIWEAEHPGESRPEHYADPATIMNLRAELEVMGRVHEEAAAVLRGKEPDPRLLLMSPLVAAAKEMRRKIEDERRLLTARLEAMHQRLRDARVE